LDVYRRLNDVARVKLWQGTRAAGCTKSRQLSVVVEVQPLMAAGRGGRGSLDKGDDPYFSWALPRRPTVAIRKEKKIRHFFSKKRPGFEMLLRYV
jgi:hypothetical protein